MRQGEVVIYMNDSNRTWVSERTMKRVSLVLFILALLFGVALPVNGEVVTTSISLGASHTFDVDTHTISSSPSSSDLWYEDVDGTERYLVPENGALIANLGIVDFDSIVDVSTYILSSNPVNASLNNNSIPVGTVLIVKTNLGNYAKMKIEAYYDPLNFTLAYQNNGSTVVPELSSLATAALLIVATLVVVTIYPRKRTRYA